MSDLVPAQLLFHSSSAGDELWPFVEMFDALCGGVRCGEFDLWSSSLFLGIKVIYISWNQSDIYLF